MAKNLTLGRILALMPHCCNKNGNGNSITTVEHTLDLNQGDILDLSGNNNKQIFGMYVTSCNEEDYNKFINNSLDFGSSTVELLNFMANSENDLQTSLEVTLDSTTYALMIGVAIGVPLIPSEIQTWYTHNPNLPVTASSHNNIPFHPISLEDLISENGIKIYSLNGNFGDWSSISKAEDFRLYCQYNSETNKLTLSIVPVIKQNNLISTVTVNGITAQDQIDVSLLKEEEEEESEGEEISTTNIIVGYPEAVGSNEYFNELSQNDVDNLNQTKGIAVLLYIPQFFSGGGLRSISVNDSTSIEANIENEEVINDLR